MGRAVRFEHTLTEPLIPTAPHSSGPFAARMAARRRGVIREGPRDGGPLPYGPEMLENRLTRRLPSRSSRVGVDDPAPVLGDEAVHDLAVRGEGAKRPDLVDAHEAAKPATSATKIAASLRFTRPVSAIGTSRPFRPQRRPPPCQDASIPVLSRCAWSGQRMRAVIPSFDRI